MLRAVALSYCQEMYVDENEMTPRPNPAQPPAENENFMWKWNLQ